MRRRKTFMKVLAAAAFLLAFAAQAHALTLEDMGCSKTSEGWLCPKDPLITTEVTLTSEVVCLSSNETGCTTDCAPIIDIGCYSTIKPVKPFTASFCTDLIRPNETFYDYSCTQQSVSQEYDALINPEVIDYSQCSKTLDTSENTSLYVITCPFAGRTAAFAGTFVNDTFFAAELAGLAAFDLAGLITQNAPYIILLIILAAVAWWAFRPRGPGGPREAAPRGRRRERYA